MPAHSTVFLFDVDNTLLDNDAVIEELCRYLIQHVGQDAADLYWEHFESLRKTLGYADYLGALQRWRVEQPHDMRLLTVSRFLVNYPFDGKLFPQALEAVHHVRQWGLPVVLSDGDVVFQPVKIYRAGLCEAFEDRVLVYIHKDKELQDVERHYPALHYVLIDDKLSILSAVKDLWGSRVTTVHVKQGHYNHEPSHAYPPADITLAHIWDLLTCTREDLMRPRERDVTPSQAG
jgi:FMN phosphatase YigB (HAD superfamily)